MQTDVLIIGQGICGTFLSWYLQQEGLSFVVMDESKPFTASKAAAGIINPVTGRRLVKAWMIEELLPFASKAYQSLEEELKIQCLSQKKIIDFFPTPQMRNAFFNRYAEDPEYLKVPPDDQVWNTIFKYDFGFGEIEPCGLVDLQAFISHYRQELLLRGRLIAETFVVGDLRLKADCLSYRNIEANRIVFCDGVEGFANPYFKLLPYAPNKGEALILEINELPPTHIFKKGMTLVPWKENLFWMGSSYQWKFDNDQPTESFLKQTKKMLKEWLRLPFRITEQLASVRPATLERRPFVGLHPQQRTLGILNGMGTKGCSLAPFFGRQLALHLAHGSPILPQADVQRFSRLLQNSFPDQEQPFSGK